VPCYELVERVDIAAGVDRLQGARKRPGDTHLREERDAPACVARDERAVAAHEPPALTTQRGVDVSEQPSGLRVGQRQQRQIF
jgi:hypothetical protein